MRIEKYQLVLGDKMISSIIPKTIEALTLGSKQETHRFTFEPLEETVNKTQKDPEHGDFQRYGKLKLFARGKWWESKEFTIPFNNV